eukprot:scaffold9477_cov197-Amphora_coffeaeformis.AAC.11
MTATNNGRCLREKDRTSPKEEERKRRDADDDVINYIKENRVYCLITPYDVGRSRATGSEKGAHQKAGQNSRSSVRRLFRSPGRRLSHRDSWYKLSNWQARDMTTTGFYDSRFGRTEHRPNPKFAQRHAERLAMPVPTVAS